MTDAMEMWRKRFKPKLEIAPGTCNECGLPKTKTIKVLWWKQELPHICRPFSDEALEARRRWAIKCMMRYHHPDDDAYKWAVTEACK